MGWDFYCDTSIGKAELVRKRLVPWATDTHSGLVLDHAVVGNHLWTVQELTSADGVKLYIGLDLLRSGGKDSGWGYKDLCESMGPYESDCPLRFLNMVPVADAAWRETVREHHARKRARVTLAAGMHVTIYGKPYTITRKHLPRGWIVEAPDGRQYRACKGIVPQTLTIADQPLDPPGYAARVAELEAEGMTTSDAQAVADAENLAAV